MLSDEWLSRYGLLENFNASVTRTRTGTGTWTTGVTAIALCTSCSRAKNVQVMTENIHFAFLYVLSIVYQLKQIETDPKMTKSEFEMFRTFRNKLKQG